ncbi:MAG: aquaporin [Schumannella sp.]|nr:aquaporin [Schumannella sp.]
MADAAAPYSLTSRLIAEVFGTFVLVFGVIGTALFASKNVGFLGIAIAVGLAVLTAAYAVGHISGGHFNPAVSLGAAAAGRMKWADVGPYVIAQILGGLLATLLIWLFLTLSGLPTAFDEVSNGYDAHSPAGFGMVSVLLAEVVATAVFLWIILGVTAPGSTTAGFAPLAIGLALTMAHLVMIPISNASLNPARSIATAVFGGPDALAQLWAFLLAPAVGGLLAGFTWKALFARA